MISFYYEDGWADFYPLIMDLDPASLVLQEEEVKTAKWASKEEVFDMIDEGTFIPAEKDMIGLLFALKDRRTFLTRKDDSVRKL